MPRVGTREPGEIRVLGRRYEAGKDRSKVVIGIVAALTVAAGGAVAYGSASVQDSVHITADNQDI